VRVIIPLLLFFIAPLSVFAGTTVYTATEASPYITVAVDAGDVLLTQAEIAQTSGTCLVSNNLTGTLQYYQSSALATTSFPQVRVSGGQSGSSAYCDATAIGSFVATTSESVTFYMGSTAGRIRMILQHITPDSGGGGGSATTTVELPASATAFNLAMVYFLFFIVWCACFYLGFFVMKRLTS